MLQAKNTLDSYFVTNPIKQTQDIENTPESSLPILTTSTQDIQAVIQPSNSGFTFCEPQESATRPESPTISTSKSYVKCNGLNLVVPTGSNIYESFPFAFLASKSVT